MDVFGLHLKEPDASGSFFYHNLYPGLISVHLGIVALDSELPCMFHPNSSDLQNMLELYSSKCVLFSEYANTLRISSSLSPAEMFHEKMVSSQTPVTFSGFEFSARPIQ